MQESKLDESKASKRNELLNMSVSETKKTRTPLEIQIINFVGLEKFVMNQFVFRGKKPSTYRFNFRILDT